MWLFTPLLLPVGRNAPKIAVPDLSGERRDLAWLLDRRHALILDFFFLGCAPCLEGFATLGHLFERYERNGLAVAGVSRGDSRDALRAFASKSGIGFVFLAAADDDPVFRSYRVLAYPTIYLIDGSGRIVYRRVGHHPSSLQAALNKLGLTS